MPSQAGAAHGFLLKHHGFTEIQAEVVTALHASLGTLLLTAKAL